LDDFIEKLVQTMNENMCGKEYSDYDVMVIDSSGNDGQDYKFSSHVIFAPELIHIGCMRDNVVIYKQIISKVDPKLQFIVDK
jgi:hypothetical protein